VLLGLSIPAFATAQAPEPGPFEPTPAELRIAVTLETEAAAPAVATFAVPFPRGWLAHTGDLAVTDRDGRILPSRARELARWRVLGRDGFDSVRSAVVSVETDRLRWPVRLYVVAGATPKRPAADLPEASQPVIATFEAEYLGKTLLRTRTLPVGANRALRWFDEALIGYAQTAINDVPASVTAANRIDYDSSAEPWQLDRASTLWNVYIRTGDARWFREARAATRYYASRIGPRGEFNLKTSYADLKYSYGLPLLIDYLLTGDETLLAPLERIAAFGATFPATYSPSLGFWTERHQAYALLAALTAWEATGKPQHAERVSQLARGTFRAAREPAGTWTADGCVLHTMRQHEGDADDRPVCSPWMNALLGEAIWRYYLMSEDQEALEFLAGLARFVTEHGVRDISAAHRELKGLWAPWYLASSEVQHTDSGPWADLEHECDVAGLVMRGAWATHKLGRDAAAALATAERLLAGCKRNLASWHRTSDPQRPEWRLSPPRKFNWWFGTTSDLTWFATALEE
jgi:hypothetical protein